MLSTDIPDVSEPLRLTPQQQRVLESLIDRETEKYPLSRWYLGALYALSHDQNPDRVAQAAHSLRELLEKLPLVIVGLDTHRRPHQKPESTFPQMRSKIEEHILRYKECHPGEWEGQKIDNNLAAALGITESYIALNKQPTRRERMQMSVSAIDPMVDRFDKQTGERKRNQLYHLWIKLENFAHHGRIQNTDEFHKYLKKLENAVIDLLAPITAENQYEIQSILKNADRSEADVENLFSLIERRGANFVFFFKYAADTADNAWLVLLKEKGYFTHPPNAEITGEDEVKFPFWWPMHYLRKIAPHAPDEVIQIVLRLPKTDNPWIYNEILEIALKLQATQSARLEPKILEYVGIEHNFSPYQFADVLVHWTAENQTAAALKLAELLVKFLPDPQDMVKRKRRKEESKNSADIAAMVEETYLHPSPRFGDMDYVTILSDGVRPLAQKEPLKVALILINATAKMIRLRTKIH